MWYQKVHITTTTSMSTSTTQTLTFTSTTSTTTPLAFRSVGQEWIVGGPCEFKDMCLESPNYPYSYGPHESCVASLPAFSTIRIDDFVTEKYFDPLTINGYMYSGSGLNKASTCTVVQYFLELGWMEQYKQWNPFTVEDLFGEATNLFRWSGIDTSSYSWLPVKWNGPAQIAMMRNQESCVKVMEDVAQEKDINNCYDQVQTLSSIKRCVSER